jgi:osmotically-inducible protein OsmY
MTNRTSDALVTGKVKTKLFTVDDLDATRVKVVTENGVVYLMGIMNRADADRAAVAASYVGGVDKVVKLFEYKD